ncbi:MAG: trypsin-like peptidase domain-containing protein [Planctomycetes bacterium]|nr:trypsin-like peptidase domain-containing protein [Planctomycetota bacterium]
MRRLIVVGLVLLAVQALGGTVAFAQIAPLPHRAVKVDIDSGRVLNMAFARGVVYSTTIQVPDATWLRLTFDEATLARTPAGGHSTVLRITSLADGATQHHTTQTLKQWSHTSAYFNGDAVRLELIADPAAGASRVRITQVTVGVPGGDVLASICGPTDDRLPSDDPRAGRALPIGCTAWLFDDANNCLLTAGHCSTASLQVIEFNVPLSNGGGGIQHPGPEDQYTVDVSSKQSVAGGVGNDWGYFGCFPNTETGLTPGEAQGVFFTLADSPPPVQGQNIRITGYGVDSSPPEWNQTQQTHAGPYVTFSGSTVQYRTDTTGGNSGSPVINDENGLAIGIHTHGGCDAGGGQNSGTGSNHAGWQAALADPQGVCVSLPPLSFNFPDGLPELLNPAGDTIRVEVFGQNGGEPQPGTGKLHYDLGGGFIEIDMIEVDPNIYDAQFPSISCTTQVNFFFSALTTKGEEITNPSLAPDAHYNALSAVGFEISFADDFEADLGWSTTNNAGDGQWGRGVPVDCDRGDPPTDADGSGQCFLTDNSSANGCNSDVDDGSVTLTSPTMDASAEGSVISYWRWYSNVEGSSPFQDIFVVEVSDNNGSSWVNLEIVGPSGPEVSGGWFEKQFAVADFVDETDQFRIRFIASDTDPQSVVEAAIDGLRLFTIICDEPILGDLDGDGVVGVKDLLILLGEWGPCDDCNDCLADLDDDCTVGVKDLLILLGNWG